MCRCGVKKRRRKTVAEIEGGKRMRKKAVDVEGGKRERKVEEVGGGEIRAKRRRGRTVRGVREVWKK